MQASLVSSLTPADSLLNRKSQDKVSNNGQLSFAQLLAQASDNQTDQLSARAVDQTPAVEKVSNNLQQPSIKSIPVEKVTINGNDVIVSGHGFEIPESKVKGTELEQIVYTQEMREHFESVQLELRSKGSEGIATMIVPDEPIQGSGRLTPVSVFNLGLQPGEVYLSNDPNAVARYERQKLSEFIEKMEMVKNIEQRYGSDVKVAFDPEQQSYVMLRPGDKQYENVFSGKESDENLKMILNDDPRRYNYLGDILARYNYS